MTTPEIRFYTNGDIKVGSTTLSLSKQTIEEGIVMDGTSQGPMAIGILVLHVKELYETIIHLENKLRTINTRFGA